MTRKFFLPVLLAFGLLLNGCGGNDLDADLKKPGDEVRKTAEGLSADELEKRTTEIEKRSQALQKSVGTREPNEKEMAEATKLMEVGGIYATELVKKKLK